MHKFTLGESLFLLIGFFLIGIWFGLWIPFVINLVLLVIQLIPRIVNAVKENKRHNYYIENEYKKAFDLFEEDLSGGAEVKNQESLQDDMDDYYQIIIFSFEDKETLYKNLNVLEVFMIEDKVVPDFKKKISDNSIKKFDLIDFEEYLSALTYNIPFTVLVNIDKKFFEAQHEALVILRKYIFGIKNEEL